MKKNSLVSKLLVTFTAIIAFTFIIIATVLSMWFEDYYYEENNTGHRHGLLSLFGSCRAKAKFAKRRK